MMTRTRTSLALACVLALAPSAWSAVPEGRRPNILFLLTDDQRADTVGALGNPAIATPIVDGLVARGFAFRDAYCMGGDRPAVCLPSRTMLLSGRSLFRLDRLGPGSPSLPRSLREAGYETYHHGKRGNTPHAIHEDFEHSRYLADDQAERRSGYPGKEIADAAVAFFRDRERDRPFFAYLAFGNPHDPRVANAEDRARYPDDAIPLPSNFRPLHPFDNGELTIRDEALAPWPRTPEVVRKELADYYAVITHMDRQIGRVLDAIREAGDLDNTIVVFTSDQGLAMGSHGLFGKQNLYDAGMKVPLVLAGPGIPHGGSDALVYLHDLYPTLCDLAGVPVPEGLDGQSFAPVLTGKAESAREALFFAYRSVQRGIRRGDWKLLRYPQVDVTQLFDLAADPDETRDLAADPAQAGRVAELMDALRREQEAAGDTLPLTVADPKPAAVDADFFRKSKR